jgi:hypothetical protein
MLRPARPYDCIAGPDLLDALVLYIEQYRSSENSPQRQQEAALLAFPLATGGDYAVALVRANRRRDGR